MMLKPYSISDFPLLEKWITDADLLLQFAGTDFSFPLTQEQISAYQQLHPERRFYIGYSDNGIPFAFGEIIPQDSGQPRLGRLLVGEARQRGQGFGRYFVQMLVEECKTLYACQQVELLVWDKNQMAIRCYQSAGFEYLPEKHLTMQYEGKSYDIYKMRYSFPQQQTGL